MPTQMIKMLSLIGIVLLFENGDMASEAVSVVARVHRTVLDDAS